MPAGFSDFINTQGFRHDLNKILQDLLSYKKKVYKILVRYNKPGSVLFRDPVKLLITSK